MMLVLSAYFYRSKLPTTEDKFSLFNKLQATKIPYTIQAQIHATLVPQLPFLAAFESLILCTVNSVPRTEIHAEPTIALALINTFLKITQDEQQQFGTILSDFWREKQATKKKLIKPINVDLCRDLAKVK